MSHKDRSIRGSRCEVQRIYNQRKYINKLEKDKVQLQQENNQLRKRIDKTIQAIDELLIYSDFNDTTNGFGNVKEELKFYLSDCKTLEEFKARDLLKGDKE